MIRRGKICEHEWVYETEMIVSELPKYNKICIRCGRGGRDTVEEKEKFKLTKKTQNI